MTQPSSSDQETRSPWRWALMGDVPAVLDSIWRRVEFYLYRPGGYDCDTQQALGTKLTYQWRHPANSLVFRLYALLSVFVVIGPTLDTFCGLGGQYGLTAIKVVVSLIALRVAYLVFKRFYSATQGRLAWRFRSDGPAAGDGSDETGAQLASRKRIAKLALRVIGIGASLPPLILIFGLLFSSTGPSQCIGNQLVWPTVLQLVLIIGIAIASAFVLKWFRRADRGEQQYQHASLYVFGWLVLLWVAAIVALLPWALDPEAREAAPGPYVQTAWFGMGALMLIVAWARWFVQARIAALPMAGVTDLRTAISSTKLLNVLEDETPPPKGRGWAAIITGIGMRPLQVLLLPAFFAITVPRSWIWGFVALGLALSGFASTYGMLRERWQQVVSGIERWFFVGLPLPVSVLVILLGVLRLMNEQYVSTILEAAPIGTIFTGVMIAYLMAWFFEVWINRWLAEEVLKRLGATEKQAALGAMEVQGPGDQYQDWQIAKPLVLYVHGPGRIGVEGWHERAKNGVIEREERFANYTFVALFRTLIGNSDADRSFIDEMQRQVRVYFYSINAMVVIAVGALLYWHGWAAAPEKMQPVISATSTDEGVNLAAKLTGSNEPALIVAASGGGTRAALYTAYALQGLHSIDQARNVVLISGVSGGGAAAAAFVQRFTALTTSEHRDLKPAVADPWHAYRQALTEPFIADVLDGVNELRIAGSVAMGQLLAESMQRRLFGGATFATLSDKAPALILNSTISGHPVRDSQLLNQRAAWQDGGDGCDSGRRAFGSLAGSRMVYTTLGRNSFAMPNVVGAPDVRFDFRVVNDATTSLAAATALNANFPPVFPNARVDIARPADGCDDKSDVYYVTDGGATENLGLISALVALDNTLQGLSTEAWSTLRPLHLIAIEASAMDYEYSQDRGIGAATGGSKERIAGGLTQLLMHKINQSLEQHQRPKLEVSFLPLPLAFRSRGGFGTHWMYAQTIKVTNPLRDEIPDWYEFWKSCGSPCRVTLHQDDIAALWSGLFRKGGGFCKHPLSPAKDEALTVQRWVCGGTLGSDAVIDGDQTSGKPDWQVDEWERLVKMLGGGQTVQR